MAKRTTDRSVAAVVAALLHTFHVERQRFAKGTPAAAARRLERVGLAVDTRAPRSPRAMAYTTGESVTLYERALELPPKNLRALIRHELAHVALWKVTHSERDADKLAEQLGGEAISYDGCGVQTTGKGRRPRPRGLR